MPKKKILLVEDEADLRLLVKTNLEECGYEIYEAAQGDEGITRLREVQPDLIITDVLMPKMNGNEFIQKARALEAGKDIPVIVLTVRKLMKDYFEDIHVDAFISKPFSTKDLAEKIEQVFRQKEEKTKKTASSHPTTSSSAQAQQKTKKPAASQGDQYCNRCDKRVPADASRCPNCGGSDFRETSY